MIQFPPSKDPIIKGELTNEIQKMVERYGQEYTPALLPKDIERGPLGKCFDTCLVNIVFNPKYQYVEGMAEDAHHPGTWLYHSWLTDGVHAFDPTWTVIDNPSGEERVMPIRYVGIPMPGAFVMYFNQETQYAGVLGNRAKHPKAVDKMLKYRRLVIKQEVTSSHIRHGEYLATNHYRGELSDKAVFVYCPVGNIVSWSPGDYEHKWCHFCKKYFMEIHK